eukprot:9421195-Pyramimonas_sp.AAC.1
MLPAGLEQSTCGEPSGLDGDQVLQVEDEGHGSGPDPDSVCDTASQRSLSIVYSNISAWGPAAC